LEITRRIKIADGKSSSAHEIENQNAKVAAITSMDTGTEPAAAFPSVAAFCISVAAFGSPVSTGDATTLTNPSGNSGGLQLF
jgi:hypothetical protein